jgi:hypothetical protein
MNDSGATSTVLAGGRKLPSAWVVLLRPALLICVIALGHKPGLAPGWMSLVLPAGSESSRPVESESPADSQESEAGGEYLFHGQRSERSLRGDLARCKLPPNHLTAHFAHGRGFLIAESCFGSEHALRSGTCSHLRC